MKFSEAWLREWIDPPFATAELSARLTMAGLEVDGQSAAAPALSGVVVAEIIAVQPHPNADRLRLCRVNAGERGELEVVCGAPNVRVGLRVPLVLAGARLGPRRLARLGSSGGAVPESHRSSLFTGRQIQGQAVTGGLRHVG